MHKNNLVIKARGSPRFFWYLTKTPSQYTMLLRVKKSCTILIGCLRGPYFADLITLAN